MKYLCKKTYSKDIIIGKFYDCVILTNSKMIQINSLLFLTDDNNLYCSPKINDYFYSEKEIRKIKLEILCNIK